MHFEWTINLGNVVSVAILITGFYKAHIQNVKRLDKIESELDIVFEWFKKNFL